MRKTAAVFLILAMAVILAGCQEKASPEDRLGDYIELWNKQEFEEMYNDYLNEGTQSTFGTEEFIDRQIKLHEDLGIEIGRASCRERGKICAGVGSVMIKD